MRGTERIIYSGIPAHFFHHIILISMLALYPCVSEGFWMFIPSSFSSFWDLIFPLPCGVDELDGGYIGSSCGSLLPSVTWHLGFHTDKKDQNTLH